MRRAIIVGLVAVLPLALVPSAEAITYGSPDGNQHPYVGALLYEPDPGVWLPGCSGTLISPAVFLTAAHCLLGETRAAVTFDEVVGTSTTPLWGTVHVHPAAWTGGLSDPFDLAVVVLDAPILSITPAQLPQAGALDHKELRYAEFTAVGYGTTRDTQQGGWQPILDNNRRNYATQSFLSLQKAWALLSMNPATGSGGTCYGDSGGPHLLSSEAPNLIVSITVTGDRWCKATDKTYRLDTPAAREFLGDYVTLP